jgi:hypothetical protein
MSPARTHLIAFVVLAALVAAELALRALHLPPALTLATLGALAVANSAGVVAFHMNLRREPRATRLVFVAPLILPLLFAVAVVADAAQQGIRP